MVKKAAPKKAASKRVMPKFEKAPGDLVALFTQAAETLEGVEIRKMFGYPAAFTSGGNMFSSLFGDHVILRLAEAERAAMVARHGARPFEPIPGRPMREYVELPKALRETQASLAKWLEAGRAYAASLPPKKAGAAKRGK
jgi:TfoX/Sxy family transcriptional regulator of competence genes